MINILCYGDSNTYGYDPHTGGRYDESVRWPCRLQSYLGDEYHVIEAGLNGRTTCYDDPNMENVNALKTLETDLEKYDKLDLIAIMLGTNDLKEFTGADVNEIVLGVEKVMMKMKSIMKEKQDRDPIFLIMCPPEIGSAIRQSHFYGEYRENSIAKSRMFPTYYRQMAVKNGCMFFDTSEWVKASEADSIHLNVADHVLIAEKVCDIISSINKRVFVYKTN